MKGAREEKRCLAIRLDIDSNQMAVRLAGVLEECFWVVLVREISLEISVTLCFAFSRSSWVKLWNGSLLERNENIQRPTIVIRNDFGFYVDVTVRLSCYDRLK